MKQKPKFCRYSELNDLWGNREMHTHTVQTDGKGTIEQVLQRAVEVNLAELAFTEHVRADSEWFSGFAAEVRKLSATQPLRTLVGAEVRITDFHGSLDVSGAIRSQCDILLASVHRFPDQNGKRINFPEIPKDEFAGIEFNLALGLIRQGDADVLAHPGGMSCRWLGGFPDEYYRVLLKEAAMSGLAVEINSSYIKDLEKFLGFLAEADPYVSIGSDAHLLSQVGECRDKLKEILWNH